MIIEKQWTTKFFNTMYLDMFMTRTHEQLFCEAQIIKFFLQAQPNSSILDFCCGTGSTANFLGSLGFDMSGIEYSQEYVDIGKQSHPHVNIVQGDALTYNFNKNFNYVTNWFSSFGYFNDEQNMLLLKNMKKHLNTNGKILIEIYNSENILSNFNQQLHYHKQYKDKTYLITRNSTLIEKDKWLQQDWLFENELTGDIEFQFTTKTRLYLANDILDMLTQIGFNHCQSYHRPDNLETLCFNKPNANSKRIIITGDI